MGRLSTHKIRFLWSSHFLVREMVAEKLLLYYTLDARENTCQRLRISLIWAGNFVVSGYCFVWPVAHSPSRARSRWLERSDYIGQAKVIDSSEVKYGPVAHLARAPRLHRGGKGFDSLQLHHHKTDFPQGSLFFVIRTW